MNFPVHLPIERSPPHDLPSLVSARYRTRATKVSQDIDFPKTMTTTLITSFGALNGGYDDSFRISQKRPNGRNSIVSIGKQQSKEFDNGEEEFDLPEPLLERNELRLPRILFRQKQENELKP
ncbi:unnamed protein product [Soboliphyme baturini]|uniref:Uncharacterized protein n=1 Tax=Soboliphyme baturini TaxID=241478 RepID=A0A183IUU9_9BILA|nr:unnamed protein product [Soboliphyme baturini]